MRDTLQEKYDNASDKWQEGDKGQECEQNISDIEGIINELTCIEDSINDLAEE